MIGETNVNGCGGLTGKAALLKIKAPTGSNVTVSKEGFNKTLNIYHVDAFNSYWTWWFFETANYGIWTVTAEKDGNDADSVTVEVILAQEYNIQLDYKLYLYNRGNLCTNITGGWRLVNSSGTTQISSGGEKYRYDIPSGYWGKRVFTNKVVDTSNYDELHVIIGTNNATNFGLSSKNTTRDVAYDISKNITTNRLVETEYVLDISTIGIDSYIAIGPSVAGTTGHYTDIYEIWLKKRKS